MSRGSSLISFPVALGVFPGRDRAGRRSWTCLPSRHAPRVSCDRSGSCGRLREPFPRTGPGALGAFLGGAGPLPPGTALTAKAALAATRPTHAGLDLVVGFLEMGCMRHLGQEQPLADRPEAAGDEVEAQSGGDLVEHGGHEDHHELHGLLLHLRLGSGRRRREELGLEEHEPHHHDRQDVEPVAQPRGKQRDLERDPEQHIRARRGR